MKSSDETPPTRDELLSMAYADGELESAARVEFEARLAREPELAREVTAQRRLGLLARAVAPAEPEDHEWARLARSPWRARGFYVAWALILIGVVGAACIGEFELVRSDVPTVLKWFLSALGAGIVLLFCLVLRGRLRTRVYDPYTEVKR